MITILEKHLVTGVIHTWWVRLEIDGHETTWSAPPNLETEQEILDYLNAHHDEILTHAQEDFCVREGLFKGYHNKIVRQGFTLEWNPITKELDISKPTKTAGAQTAEDFMIQGSPPIPSTPEEALAIIETELAKNPTVEPISVGSIAFSNPVMVVDIIKNKFPPSWGDYYKQARDYIANSQQDLLDLQGMNLNNVAKCETAIKGLADVIHKRGLILDALLVGLKNIFKGTE